MLCRGPRMLYNNGDGPSRILFHKCDMSLKQTPSTDLEKRLPEDKLGASHEVTYNESDTLSG